MEVERPQSLANSSGWATDYALYPLARYAGAPRRPIMLGARSSGPEGVQLLDWIVPDRVEVISEGGGDAVARGECAGKFCIYLADRPTWIG